MKESFLYTLDERTANYVREALADTETVNPLEEHFDNIERQAAEATREVESKAYPDDALAFTRELGSFLSRAKSKALEARHIEKEIEQKQAEVVETKAEIRQLSASLPALADTVREALSKYEEVRYEHNVQEFQIATLSTRLSMCRGELAELRRRLTQLRGQEV